jgi:hypothetical protein
MHFVKSDRNEEENEGKYLIRVKNNQKEMNELIH